MRLIGKGGGIRMSNNKQNHNNKNNKKQKSGNKHKTSGSANKKNDYH